jgi:hypothetical protein
MQSKAEVGSLRARQRATQPVTKNEAFYCHFFQGASCTRDRQKMKNGSFLTQQKMPKLH